MTIIERNLPLMMVRPTLDNLPEYALPPGYTIRWHAPGDEQHWLRIHEHADRYNTITPEVFERGYGSDPQLHAQRILYLCDESGAPIGTAGAWFGDESGNAAAGRVHW